MKNIKDIINECSYAGYEEIIDNISNKCSSKEIIEISKDIASKGSKPIYGVQIIQLIDALVEYIESK